MITPLDVAAGASVVTALILAMAGVLAARPLEDS